MLINQPSISVDRIVVPRSVRHLAEPAVLLPVFVYEESQCAVGTGQFPFRSENFVTFFLFFSYFFWEKWRQRGKFEGEQSLSI